MGWVIYFKEQSNKYLYSFSFKIIRPYNRTAVSIAVSNFLVSSQSFFQYLKISNKFSSDNTTQISNNSAKILFILDIMIYNMSHVWHNKALFLVSLNVSHTHKHICSYANILFILFYLFICFNQI